MSIHYVDKNDPDVGSYQVFTGDKGSRWQWSETAKGVKHFDEGRWLPTVADAYRDAADDWEVNGSPSSNSRLSGQLRAAATRAEKKA